MLSTMNKMAVFTITFLLLQSVIVLGSPTFFLIAQATEKSEERLGADKYTKTQESESLLSEKTMMSSELFDFSRDSSKTPTTPSTNDIYYESISEEMPISNPSNEIGGYNSIDKQKSDLSIDETPEIDNEKTSNCFEELFSNIDFKILKNEVNRPDISFVIDTFQAEVSQSIDLVILLKSERNEFDLRIPENATIDVENLDKGIEINHQEGEYWDVKLDSSKEVIEIPIIFKSAGAFFVSVDHDGSHMFVEVSASPIKKSRDTKSKKAIEEAHLFIPRELEEKEEARILETTLDESRTTSTVYNWSQFRTAWNNSSTSQIVLPSSISYSSSIGSSSLNTRNSSIVVSGGGTNKEINFLNSGNSLAISGRANLAMDNITLLCTNDELIGRDSRTNPFIYHTGTGEINIKGGSLQMRTGTASSVVRGYNINLSGAFTIGSYPAFRNTATINASAVELLSGGTLTIKKPDSRANLLRSPNSNRPVISSPANSFINIDVSEFTMVDLRGIQQWVPLTSWNRVSAELTGVNGRNVLRSNTDPNDFSSRYSEYFNKSNYGGLVFHSRNSNEWVTPPIIKHSLLLEASPSEGGNPTATSASLVQGETTTINANPNIGYYFSKWEIISGDGASISNSTASSTTLTIGNTDLTVRAVYEEIKQVSPVDPLEPENEVDPENKPELPEDQGFLSIDFVSQFNFGIQNISVNDQIYYAYPQRLLNEDEKVKKIEERPNYVQISDRRPANERNGWQLSVTQNGQFRNESGHELIGSEIQLFNQELVTAQGGTAPKLKEESLQRILPNTRKVLLQAEGESGTGTWIYRFGDQKSADESVGLYVPKGTNPEAISYSTKLTWELSSVPDN